MSLWLGKMGIFFNSVFIDPESHTIAWQGGIDLCPDNLYAKILELEVDPLTILKKDWLKGATPSKIG